MANTEFNALANFEIVHLGINNENKEEAEKAATLFSLITGKEVTERSKSYFSGKAFELMFTKGRGTHGHLALGVDDIDDAVAYLKTKGFTFDEDSRTYKNDRCNFIYMNEEIAGFAIHLLLR
jgi:2-dehydro-3-deoxyphosphogluconate aldolase/(4S)-4-hydroxy-2-oxoglutarate aldolase